MKKGTLINLLSQLGFRAEDLTDDGFGLRIRYENVTMLCSSEDESETLDILVPNIFEVNDANQEAVLEAMIKLTGTLKFVQPYITASNDVWLQYSHYFGDLEPNTDTIEHIIKALSLALKKFHEYITN